MICAYPDADVAMPERLMLRMGLREEAEETCDDLERVYDLPERGVSIWREGIRCFTEGIYREITCREEHFLGGTQNLREDAKISH